jgi:hypothetical protein
MPLDQQRVLNALTRLNEPHTRPSAWEELSRLVPSLDAYSGNAFLSCLLATNAQFTLPCRTGAVRLYGVVAERLPHLLKSIAGKVVDSIVARARDKDGGRELRDTCAESLGLMLASDHASLPHMLRGVLPLLAEPNEHTQLAGLACVSGLLVRASAAVGDAAAAKIAVALLRLLGHCWIGAHAAALEASALLLDKCAASAAPHAPSFVNPCIQGTESREWATRRAAAMLLETLATEQQPAALAQARRLVPAVQALRHDKHKAVRDAAAQAAGALRGMGADAAGGGCGANLPAGRATSVQLRERIRVDRAAARQRAAASEAGGIVDDSDKFSVVSSEGRHSIASAPPRMSGAGAACQFAEGASCGAAWPSHRAATGDFPERQQWSRPAYAAADPPGIEAAGLAQHGRVSPDRAGTDSVDVPSRGGAGGVAAARRLRPGVHLGVGGRLDTIMSLADGDTDVGSESLGDDSRERLDGPLVGLGYNGQSLTHGARGTTNGTAEEVEDEMLPDGDSDTEPQPEPASHLDASAGLLDGSGGLSDAELRRSLRWVRSQLDQQLDASMVAWASDNEADPLPEARTGGHHRSDGGPGSDADCAGGFESDATLDGEDGEEEDSFERQIERLERGVAPPPPLRTFAANSARRRDSAAAAEAGADDGSAAAEMRTQPHALPHAQPHIQPPRAWPLGGRPRPAKPPVLVAPSQPGLPTASPYDERGVGTAQGPDQLRAELAQALRDGIAAEARARAAEVRLAQAMAESEAEAAAAAGREAEYRRAAEQASRRAAEAVQGREAALAAADGALETAAAAARAAEVATAARDAAMARADTVHARAATNGASGSSNKASGGVEAAAAEARALAAEAAARAAEAARTQAVAAAEAERSEVRRLTAALAVADERRRVAESEAAQALRQAEGAVAAAAKVSDASEAQRLAAQGREKAEARAASAETALAAVRAELSAAAEAAAAREAALARDAEQAALRVAAAEAAAAAKAEMATAARKQVSTLEASVASREVEAAALLTEARAAAAAAVERADSAEAAVTAAAAETSLARMELQKASGELASAMARAEAAESAAKEAAATEVASREAAAAAEARASQAVIAAGASASAAEQRAAEAVAALEASRERCDASDSARKEAEEGAQSARERVRLLEGELNRLSEERTQAAAQAAAASVAQLEERAESARAAAIAAEAAAGALAAAEQRASEADGRRDEVERQLTQAKAQLTRAEAEARGHATRAARLEAAQQTAEAMAREAALASAEQLDRLGERLAEIEAHRASVELERNAAEERAAAAEQQAAALSTQLGMAHGVAGVETEKRRAAQDELALLRAQVAHDAEMRAQAEAERVAAAIAASRPGAGKGVNKPRVEKAPIVQTQFQLHGLGKAPPAAAARRATSAQQAPRR